MKQINKNVEFSGKLKRDFKEWRKRNPSPAPNRNTIEEYASLLRDRRTPSEYRVLTLLRQSRFEFKFQHVIGSHIVDFYVPKLNMVIEIDGSQHYTRNGLESDLARSESIEALVADVDITRWTNSNVYLYRFSQILTDALEHREKALLPKPKGESWELTTRYGY